MFFGQVVFWNATRNYGFISGGGKRFFFHPSKFEDINNEATVLGAHVWFSIAPAISLGKADQAVDIRFATLEEIHNQQEQLSGGMDGLVVKGGG
jgi:cold shock CspA family protein